MIVLLFRKFLAECFKLREESRQYRSRMLVPAAYWVYGIALMGLPSSWVRIGVRRWAKNEKREKSADTIVSCLLESYLILTTAVLVSGVYTFRPDDTWLWDFWTGFVLVVVVLRMVEILSQSVEVIMNRIFVDVPSTLVTLAMYTIQSVAIFTICAELVGPSGYGPPLWILGMISST
ncbi:hypothetical protein HYG77_38775 (plasmid) [Rhodococcus sp. ZPP]|uniref:hypothetical protein n=1 Tax=Rhodococcus sp. ZPP TaxID=2749906 RepID=UPI001AD886EA|nr:hypothetical protein [Rhodococcus sp. ZPP]QTJ71381.1 hypothetical protein HYG77_38775 [Rhodococcus sp. ZPP]